MSSDPGDLSNLRDLAMPAPVDLWPPPLGWWILAAGMAVIAAILLFEVLRRHHANAYRRSAKRELLRLPPTTGMAEISELLKRTALAAYSRDMVASLTGTAWLQFLDRTGTTSDFSTGPGRLLPAAVAGGFRVLDTSERDAIVDCARRWIETHRRC